MITERETAELVLKDSKILSLENRLNAVLSLEQFDDLVAKMSLYHAENVAMTIKCVELGDVNTSLARQLGLSNTRAEQLESLLSESQKEHEDTKAKLKIQKQKAECTQKALEKIMEEKRRRSQICIKL